MAKVRKKELFFLPFEWYSCMWKNSINQISQIPLEHLELGIKFLVSAHKLLRNDLVECENKNNIRISPNIYHMHSLHGNGVTLQSGMSGKATG